MSDPQRDAMVTLALECETLREERDRARIEATVVREMALVLRRRLERARYVRSTPVPLPRRQRWRLWWRTFGY